MYTIVCMHTHVLQHTFVCYYIRLRPPPLESTPWMEDPSKPSIHQQL